MAGFGIREEDIARVFEISMGTLRKHYRTELDNGHILCNFNVAHSLYNKCLGDGSQAVTACIFWCKTRLHWRDPAFVTEVVSKKDEQRWAAKRAGIGSEWGDDLVTVPTKTLETAN